MNANGPYDVVVMLYQVNKHIDWPMERLGDVKSWGLLFRFMHDQLNILIDILSRPCSRHNLHMSNLLF